MHALARCHVKFQTQDSFHVLDLKCGAGIDSDDSKSDSMYGFLGLSEMMT